MDKEEDNQGLRDFNKKKAELNMLQKSIFKKLFQSGITIDYKDPKIIKLIAMGVPSLYRKHVWPALMQNVHGVTINFYHALIKKAELYIEAEEHALCPERSKIIRQLNSIEKDIERTFPELKIFKKDNDQGQSMFNILSAWTVYREDVGYIQGMSQIVGLLLLQLKELEAFSIFCTMMTTDVLFAYYSMEAQEMRKIEHSFETRLKKGEQEIYLRLKELKIEPGSYLLSWILTLFTRVMSLDMVSHLWDVLLLYDLSEAIVVEVSFYIVKKMKKKILFHQLQSEELFQVLKSAKLSDKEADEIISDIRTFYR